MNTQKGFVLPIVIAIIVIAVLGAGGYFVYQNYSTISPEPKTETPAENITDQNQNQELTNNNSASQPSITVTSPNGGEVWQVGTTQKITWTTNFADKVLLRLMNYEKNDSCTLTYEGISAYASNINSDLYVGEYDYSVVNTGQCPESTLVGNKLKLSVIGTSNDGLNFSDESDNYFTITNSTTLNIDSISPTIGQVGTLVTLMGNFPTWQNTSSNKVPYNVLFNDSWIAVSGGSSIGNQEIAFYLPSSIKTSCTGSGGVCPSTDLFITPGSYSVSVLNPQTGAVSNKVNFVVK